MVGVEDAEEVVQSRYEELIEDDNINKVSFVFVLETEHKRLGFQNWSRVVIEIIIDEIQIRWIERSFILN